MRDVWDGSVLRNLSQPGQYFSTKSALALSLNTDGVPLYKSSSWSLWPVFLTILNLPANSVQSSLMGNMAVLFAYTPESASRMEHVSTSHVRFHTAHTKVC